MREYELILPELTERNMRKLLFSNLENTLVALTQRPQSRESFADFLKRIDKVKKENLTKEQKRSIIAGELGNLEKIQQRYFKAYPK